MSLLSTREFEKDKNANFSEWYNSIIYAADLADIRYNVQGFIVHRPWSMRIFKKIYSLFENELEKDGHEPILFPTVIPEENFEIEKEHAEGFRLEVYWITQRGNEKMQRRLALRPTSETAFYQMYNLWVKSHSDLPLKLYQSCTVFRNESETNPFLRGREFLWIETHDVFAEEFQAREQVEKDRRMFETVVREKLAIPFLFFKRPEWDRFPGAVETYATDTLLPDGKALQFGTSHLLGQNFSKAFNVKFTDENGKEHYPFTTCCGPGIWRVLAALISVHGDNKGLIFPYEVAPLQVVIVPIAKGDDEKKIHEYCKKVEKMLKEANIRCTLDLSAKTPGYKYNYWELKGVPLRIEIGKREQENEKITLARRDTREKITVSNGGAVEEIVKLGKEINKSLLHKATAELEAKIKPAETKEQVAELLGSKCYARVAFCSIEKDGKQCADELQAYTKGGKVRGVLFGSTEHAKGKCLMCGKTANHMVYVAKQY